MKTLRPLRTVTVDGRLCADCPLAGPVAVEACAACELHVVFPRGREAACAAVLAGLCVVGDAPWATVLAQLPEGIPQGNFSRAGGPVYPSSQSAPCVRPLPTFPPPRAPLPPLPREPELTRWHAQAVATLLLEGQVSARVAGGLIWDLARTPGPDQGCSPSTGAGISAGETARDRPPTLTPFTVSQAR